MMLIIKNIIVFYPRFFVRKLFVPYEILGKIFALLLLSEMRHKNETFFFYITLSLS